MKNRLKIRQDKLKLTTLAFTLIELIVVLVILAVIALITTPIILNIVEKAQVSANKRSIDAYGKAVELAAAEYLLDTGEYPTTVDDLEVKYSGNEVVCNVKKINENGSVYLSECRVDGVLVKDNNTGDGYYHYDSDFYTSYKIGDKITYNGMEFYVIEGSDKSKNYVTLLKAEPLTVDEVNTYGAGHVNMYVTSHPEQSYYQKAADNYGYGGIAYYTSATCSMIDYPYVTEGCRTNYDVSEIKYAVDAWATDRFNVNDLTKDSLGYKARLLTYEELTTNLGYKLDEGSTYMKLNTETTPSWVYNEKYYYWTMSAKDYSDSIVWYVGSDGNVYSNSVYMGYYVSVRPVITLYKSAIN